MNIGLVGCGNISDVYLNIAKDFEIINYVACSDIDFNRAQKQAARYGINNICSYEMLLDNREIEIILNLTPPKEHASIGISALKSGKAIYSEKPIAINRDEANALLDLATLTGMQVGCGPDTFLGAGIQTCRKMIDDGIIGEPIAATAFMMCHGHESWHPNPEFYYKSGGGPLLDMGPYYLTALVTLLGSVKRVTGFSRISFPERIITSPSNKEKRIAVEVPTHVAGILEFNNGAITTLVTSFDIWSSKVPHIEIYGTQGTMIVPDPNTFNGPVYIRDMNSISWREVSLSHEYSNNSRGIGLVDMCYGILSGKQHRANLSLAYHVLDIMQSIEDSANSNCHIELKSTCMRPTPLIPGSTIDQNYALQ